MSAYEAEGVPTGLATVFAARTRAADGGHREWAAGTNTRAVGRFQHAGVPYTAARAAFVIRTGRQPVGPVRAACGRSGCVEPGHVDDRATRERDRAALAAITGIAHRPPSCSHDPAVHGRHRADGRRYCDACNNDPGCAHGATACGARPSRPYPCGRRCDEHQPARTRPHALPTP